jgi:hypothetical protein
MLHSALVLLAFIAVSHAHDERLLDEDGNYLGRACATEHYNEELLAANPAWKASLDSFEEEWAKTMQQYQKTGKLEYGAQQNTLMIPIIYHYVSQSPNNYPDSAFAYQLNVLQEDFSASNADYTSGTPTEFRAVRSGDLDIQFRTQTILRVQTSLSSFSTNDNIKFSSRGGSDVVSPASNLNFWVGVLSGGVLGYAQFPGGSSATDGIVDAPGTLSPTVGSPPYNQGRTATHEIGHWLNLRHIWGDNSQCTNTELISDFVLDTPPSSAANFGCPAGTKRCSQNPYTQDMWMNYMDYVYDECMVMFTELQSARAWASINQYRQGFLSNMIESKQEYVNWLYFMRFEQDTEPSDEEKCYGEHVLFYENSLNEDSESNVYIYGCLTKSHTMSVWHMTDIAFIADGKEECDEGYVRASQDLNEGNNDPIYLCYKQEESTPDNANMAILDITFVANDDASRLSDEWEIDAATNVNPSGLKLNLAVKKAAYYDEEEYAEAKLKQSMLGSSPQQQPQTAATAEQQALYIGIGTALSLVAVALIGVVVWKYVCSRKGFKEYMNETLTNEYGATTELTEMKI